MDVAVGSSPRDGQGIVRLASAAPFALGPLAPARLLLAGRTDRLKEAEGLIRALLANHPDDSAALGLLALVHARTALDDFAAGDEARLEAAPSLAALGAPEVALATLPGYFLGAGAITSPTHDPARPSQFRDTWFLFMPPMATVWPLPGLGALLAAIGLESFWRETGTAPDFRR